MNRARLKKTLELALSLDPNTYDNSGWDTCVIGQVQRQPWGKELNIQPTFGEKGIARFYEISEDWAHLIFNDAYINRYVEGAEALQLIIRRLRECLAQ